MQQPALVIMAAGMGSRFGGTKQIEPIGLHRELIMDYSIYDALEAGFGRVVFIIKKEMREDFHEAIGKRIAKQVDCTYVFQELDCLPNGIKPPAGRVKPFGTGHALLCCKDVVSGPFAVINADDYYGKTAYRSISRFLGENQTRNKSYCMAGYRLCNTLSENGYVSRGVCTMDDSGDLLDVTERTQIELVDGKPQYRDGEGQFHLLSPNAIVSMNCWGFTSTLFPYLERDFISFLKDSGSDLLRGEFHLPAMVDRLLKERKATVKVLPTSDKWYGVTYKEDKANVVAAIRRLTDEGLYPEKLWI